jgi:hypothetical protein
VKKLEALREKRHKLQERLVQVDAAIAAIEAAAELRQKSVSKQEEAYILILLFG